MSISNDAAKGTAPFLAYAHSFQAVTRPGLSRIGALCTALGNPERTLSCIHVAGTNGKGSVCAFLTASLMAAGKRVGTFTSPNLVRTSERIRVNGAEIPEEEMNAILTEMAPLCDQMKREIGERPTQFELWTAAAFVWFARCSCEIVVLETGMGGAFDATNIISHNVAAVFTRIDLDHTEYLGTTHEEIAATKAGIMKSTCETMTAFSVLQEPSCETVLAREAKAHGLTFTAVPPLPSVGREGFFECVMLGKTRVTLGIGGAYQRENAALAVAVLRKLGIDDSAIAKGLAAARHKGRMEVLRQKPLLLYDGAHNPNGVRALLAAFDKAAPTLRPAVIFACMKDKEIAPSLTLLSSRASRFIFTTVQGNSRAEDAQTLRKRASRLGIEGASADTLTDALAMLAADEDALICGTLYLYADLDAALSER